MVNLDLDMLIYVMVYAGVMQLCGFVGCIYCVIIMINIKRFKFIVFAQYTYTHIRQSI